MADVDVKIGIEVVDQAARRALGDLNTSTEKIGTTAEKASDKATKAVSKISKETKTAKTEADNTGFSFSKLGDSIKNDLGNTGSQSVGMLSEVISGKLILAIGAAGVAVAGLKQWLDLTLHAERETQINNSFDAIAKSAGLAGDALRDGLVDAAKGLADTEDILEAANRAIVQMGGNAAVIPQTMEIARKATALFGGNLVDNFEKINDAIATGNTRLLKQFGIVIDTEAAQNKFAASLGTTRDKLSEAGQRQALMNAALETASTKFKDVDENSIGATNAVTRFGVAMGNLKDTTAEVVSNSGFFTTTLGYLTKLADDAGKVIGGLGGSANTADGQIAQTKERIDELNSTIQDFVKINGTNHPWLAGPRAELANLNKELATLEARAKAATPSGDFVKLSAQNSESEKLVKDPEKKKQDEVTKALEVEQTKLQAVGQLRLDVATAQRETELLSEAEFQAARQQIAIDTFQAENAALVAAREKGKITESQYLSERDKLAYKFSVDQAKRDSDDAKRTAELRKKDAEADKKLNETKLNAASQTFGNLAVLMQTSSRELFAIGKASAIAQATINTYEAITKTMASVPYPFNIPLAAAQGIAGFVQVANISQQQPKFAQGGIVPGSSYSGDRVQARVNSGEMVLNKAQQTQLFKIANGQGGSNDSTNAQLLAALSQPISINIDGKEIINVTRAQLAGGRSF